MRRLLRSTLAIFTLGLASLGCGKSGESDPPDRSGEGGGEAPYQATFRVPGMS